MREEEVQKKLLFFLRINQHLASGIGQSYLMLLEEIMESINKLYLYYSMQVNATVNQNGKGHLNYMTVRIMRTLKKEIIKVYLKFMEKCDNLNP